VTLTTTPTILVLSEYFLPGYRAGGPIRSLDGLISKLGDTTSFRVITRDRDFGEATPYAGIAADTWIAWQTCHATYQVMYLAPGWRMAPHLLRALFRTPHDTLYVNSVFSVWFSIVPIWLLMLLRWLGLGPQARTLLAPRGELGTEPLRIGSRRIKRLYLACFRAAGLHRRVLWHASTDLEAAEIRMVFGAGAAVVVARDLAPPPRATTSTTEGAQTKVPGVARLVFLSRISRKKNLRYAIDLLADVSGQVTLDIFGPTEDEAYWRECKAAAATLPANIQVRHCGVVAHRDVPAVLSRYHGFLFPTLNENFGHVILEALLAGCPPIVSDQTPWRDLQEAGVGWDVPLGDPTAFRTVVEELVALSDESFRELSERARVFGQRAAQDPNPLRQNRALFASNR
jgi:glycosyltransferase involved in cell wall biosynthesis